MLDRFRRRGEADTSESELRASVAAAEHDPERQRSARVRLLEYYYEQGRERDFLAEAKRLRDSLHGNLDAPDWRLIATIGRSVSPTSPLFDTPDTDAPRRRFADGRQYQALFAQLALDYERLRASGTFLAELDRTLVAANNRPSSLLHAERLSESVGGARIFLKREDLMASGTLLATAVTGQVLLAKALGRSTVVTATTYGQKGVMMAEAAARLGLRAVVYVDAACSDAEPANAVRMRICGGQVHRVDAASLPDRDVRHAALAHWAETAHDSLMVMGLDAAPEPYDRMLMDFAASTGRETRAQLRAMTRGQPALLVARGGDTADALGFFRPFLMEPEVRLACVTPEPGGSQLRQQPVTADAELTERQRQVAIAVLEGSEFPGVRREHAWLRQSRRITYAHTAAAEAREAITALATLEGIIPAVDSAHALAYAMGQAASLDVQQSVVVNLVERADKDIADIGRALLDPA